MRKILLLIFVALTSLHLYGQVEVSLSEISNTCWCLKNSQKGNKTVTLSFTSSSLKMHTYYQTIDRAIDKETSYYLSDVIPKDFDMKKVGNSKKGKYLNIVTKNSCITYCIDSFNGKEITLSRVLRENQVFIGGTFPATYVKQ